MSQSFGSATSYTLLLQVIPFDAVSRTYQRSCSSYVSQNQMQSIIHQDTNKYLIKFSKNEQLRSFTFLNLTYILYISFLTYANIFFINFQQYFKGRSHIGIPYYYGVYCKLLIRSFGFRKYPTKLSRHVTAPLNSRQLGYHGPIPYSWLREL